MESDLPRKNPILAAIDKATDLFIVANIVGITLLACFQVFLRYIVRMPLLGIEELCYFPTIWLYLGASVKASSEKGQLVARVLEIFISGKKNIYLLRGIAAILSCGVLCWLTYWGYDLLKYSLRLEKLTDTLFIPWLYIEGLAFIAFFLMLFYSALEAWDYFRAYRATGPVAENHVFPPTILQK
ncbi:MAG: TRAP transporter small permease [Deltaproteobacteria bacterium]|nr:TRAP transporter small permease [Deltaproteobacteria bacterium]